MYFNCLQISTLTTYNFFLLVESHSLSLVVSFDWSCLVLFGFFAHGIHVLSKNYRASSFLKLAHNIYYRKKISAIKISLIKIICKTIHENGFKPKIAKLRGIKWEREKEIGNEEARGWVKLSINEKRNKMWRARKSDKVRQNSTYDRLQKPNLEKILPNIARLDNKP